MANKKLDVKEITSLAMEINEVLSQNLNLTEDYNYVFDLIYQTILFEMGYKI